MQIHETFDECIGQESVKRTLSLYIDAFKATNRLSFLNLVTQKGGGKSFFTRKFREALVRKDGSRPPMLEVNGGSIKNAAAFFEQVYPVWVSNKAFLFIDELHAIPKDLQTLFLSVLDVKKSPVRSVEFDGMTYDFNFEEISFCGATTDQQKLIEPLRDRLRDICFEEYKENELFEIFTNNLENRVEILQEVWDSVIQTFRGNPRDCVVKAEDMKTFAAAKGIKKIGQNLWKEFCEAMGILPLGLSHSEMSLFKVIAQRGAMTLTGLAAVTGFERSVIQRDYEAMLIRKNLMRIDGKRELTTKGMKLAKSLQIV